jgi:hypothetical protein
MLRQMRRQFMLSVAICGALLAGLTSAAVAQDTNAPPGNSGIDQYLETVPDAGGNRPASNRNSSQLPARTVKRLKAAGSDGQAVANLVASTGGTAAKKPSAVTNKSERKPTGKTRADDTAARPRKVPATIAAPTLGGSGRGGMGLLLPLLLGLSTVAALLLVLYRRRSQ